MNIFDQTRKFQQQAYRKGQVKLKLKQIAVIANDFHIKSARAYRKGLRFAKRAGDALCEAKKLQRKRGTWQTWLDDNFKGSRETARIYMRLAKNWNNPEIKKARKDGTIQSLATFLSFTRKSELGPTNPEGSVASEADVLRQEIREVIGKRLRYFDLTRLKAIDEHSNEIWGAAMDELDYQLLPEHLQRLRDDSTLIWFDPENGPVRLDEEPETAEPLRGLQNRL